MGRISLVGAVVAFAVLGSAQTGRAQEVRWRHDYVAARKEATAAGKPLLLDFGTEACVWCRKLDATTFRDRAVAELLNDRFIPVKVDAEREQWLTRAVGVQSFPTLVVVSPEGKVLARQDGYVEATRLMGLLRQATPKDAPKPAAAVAAVPPPAAIPQPGAAPAKGPESALLAQARADLDAGRYLACIERCDRVMSDHPSTPAAAEARLISAAISADPVKWKRVVDQLEVDLNSVQQALETALKR